MLFCHQGRVLHAFAQTRRPVWQPERGILVLYCHAGNETRYTQLSLKREISLLCVVLVFVLEIWPIRSFLLCCSLAVQKIAYSLFLKGKNLFFSRSCKQIDLLQCTTCLIKTSSFKSHFRFWKAIWYICRNPWGYKSNAKSQGPFYDIRFHLFH